jgi:hypothetical protein
MASEQKEGAKVIHLVAFLVADSGDGTTDEVTAFAQDVAHIYGPAYVGILDYTVRADLPEHYTLEETKPPYLTYQDGQLV